MKHESIACKRGTLKNHHWFILIASCVVSFEQHFSAVADDSHHHRWWYCCFVAIYTYIYICRPSSQLLKIYRVEAFVNWVNYENTCSCMSFNSLIRYNAIAYSNDALATLRALFSSTSVPPLIQSHSLFLCLAFVCSAFFRVWIFTISILQWLFAHIATARKL